MVINEWEILASKEEIIENQPGNPSAGHQRLVYYDFKHIPTNSILHFMIHYIKPINDDALVEQLTNFTARLKETFINPLSN